MIHLQYDIVVWLVGLGFFHTSLYIDYFWCILKLEISCCWSFLFSGYIPTRYTHTCIAILSVSYICAVHYMYNVMRAFRFFLYSLLVIVLFDFRCFLLFIQVYKILNTHIFRFFPIWNSWRDIQNIGLLWIYKKNFRQKIENIRTQPIWVEQLSDVYFVFICSGRE